MKSLIEKVKSYGYRIDSREEFEAEVHRVMEWPDAIRLIENATKWRGKHVLWDPLGGDHGFLICGNNPESLAKECVGHLELA